MSWENTLTKDGRERRRGKPSSDINIGVNMNSDPELYEWVNNKSIELDTSMAGVVRAIIRAAYKKEKGIK